METNPSSCVDNFNKAVSYALTGLVAAAAFTVAGALSPLVSIVALPIFAAKALPNWLEHRKLYDETLENGSRVKYGRIPGQDYTRWNGKALENVFLSEKDREHEKINSYVHGRISHDKYKEPASSTFNTPADIDWLDREYKRRKVEDLLNQDVKMIRAFAKALIPFIGILWVLNTEFGTGGASEMGCRVCQGLEDIYSESKHWGWQEAIDQHRTIKPLEINLS